VSKRTSTCYRGRGQGVSTAGHNKIVDVPVRGLGLGDVSVSISPSRSADRRRWSPNSRPSTSTSADWRTKDDECTGDALPDGPPIVYEAGGFWGRSWWGPIRAGRMQRRSTAPDQPWFRGHRLPPVFDRPAGDETAPGVKRLDASRKIIESMLKGHRCGSVTRGYKALLTSNMHLESITSFPTTRLQEKKSANSKKKKPSARRDE
jgi:hypothetical protein